MRELIIGEVIQFGGYRWKVLDIQEDLVLIITEGIIRQKSFNDYKGDVTWADSSIRKYLNNDFYKSFTLEEQEKISPVLNINSDNQWYSSKGGEDTEDHIFLLSIEEVVCKYFGDSSKFLVNR